MKNFMDKIKEAGNIIQGYCNRAEKPKQSEFKSTEIKVWKVFEEIVRVGRMRVRR
jgi:hypothetical protein